MKIRVNKLLDPDKNRCLVIVAILVMAAVLRFFGTNPGYPPIHTDEGITHYQGLSMILNRTLDPVHNNSANRFDYLVYPIIVPLVNAIFYLFIFIPVYSLVYILLHIGDILVLMPTGVDQIWKIISINIFGPSNINVIFWGRYVTALFGTGVVLMSYLVGKQLFRSTAIGLLGALFVAVNYRQVLNSHIGLPDIYNAFFLLLAIFQMFRLLNHHTRLNYIWTGLTVALSFSTKFFFYIFTPLLLLIVYQFFQSKKLMTPREIIRFFLKINYLLMFSVMICIILALGIYHIIYLPETINQLNYLSLRNRVGTNALNFYAIAYLYHVTLGPLTSILVVLGVLIGLIRRFFITFFLLSILLPFFWFLLYYSQAGSSPRNFVTVIPLMVLFSTYTIYSLWHLLIKYSKFLAVFVIVFIVASVLLESLGNSLVVPLEYSKNWNFKLAQKWVGQNIPPGSKVVAHPTTPFFGKSVELLLAKQPDDYFLKEMQEKKAQYAVINLDHISGEFLWWMTQNFNTSRKLGWFPTTLLNNTILAKMTVELKSYIVFEALNPWQAPDNNFLVVKIPPELPFENGRLIYEENFNKQNSWVVVNDNFGNLSNFSWDSKTGYQDGGSLKIAETAGGVYSQRFVSPKIAISADKVYKIKGTMNLVKSSEINGKDGFLEANFLSENGDIIKVGIASRVDIFNRWIEKEIIIKSPPNTKFLQLVFQRGRFDFGDLRLDDVEVWESTGNLKVNDGNLYIKSKFNPSEHLFLTSNGGM